MQGVKFGPSVSKEGLVMKLWLFLIFSLSLTLKISSPPNPPD